MQATVRLRLSSVDSLTGAELGLAAGFLLACVFGSGGWFFGHWSAHALEQKGRWSVDRKTTEFAPPLRTWSPGAGERKGSGSAPVPGGIYLCHESGLLNH